MAKTKIIFDTDMGTDDAWALSVLLSLEEKCNLDVKAITIVPGNTTRDHACQNALLVLKSLKREDIKVYAGAQDSLIRKVGYINDYHGVDGFSDIYTPADKPSLDLLQKEHAVEIMRKLIEDNPNEIVIFGIGPLTNIALLFKMYPDISSKIKEIQIMGGNIQGVGNITRCAEFNFWYDPEAAQIVISEAKCKITMLPWEPCMVACRQMPHQGFRFGTLDSFGSDITNLMNPIEKNQNFRDSFVPCDAYLIACYAFPERMITKREHHHVEVELHGHLSRGQMIIDHILEQPRNVHVIEEFDVELFKKLLCWVCGHEENDLFQ